MSKICSLLSKLQGFIKKYTHFHIKSGHISNRGANGAGKSSISEFRELWDLKGLEIKLEKF